MNWYKVNKSEWKEIIGTVARELGRTELMVEKDIVVNGRFCPQSVRNFCPIVAGFNAGTYKVPACVL